MTTLLYRQDPYLRSCSARIIAVEGPSVVLDRTVAYAFSGGQVSDRATIGGIMVAQAEHDGDDIHYTLSETPDWQAGDEVEVVIDWTARLEVMRLHTAQHIVAEFFERLSGVTETTGSNVRHGKATLTYATEKNIKPLLEEVEHQANAFIEQGHPIAIDEDENGLRTWRCADISCHCAGTHVKNTNEIGMISLKRKSGGSGKEMIEIKL